MQIHRFLLSCLLPLALTLTGCKKEVTCRWMVDGAKPENLKGADPAVPLTAPWTDLSLGVEKGTVCKSTPTDLIVLFKDGSSHLDVYERVRKAAVAKGYTVASFSSTKYGVEASLTRASDRAELFVRASPWDKDVWKHAHDLSIQVRTMSTVR